MRKKIIAGNWKMNYSLYQGEEFLLSILDRINIDNVDVVVCPNYIMLSSFSEILFSKNSKVKLGAQNVYFEDKGAYTGEVSADMLNSIGVDYCIVGHSERRQYFKETDEDINKKVKKILEKDMTAILCVGETLEQRNNNEMFKIIENQLEHDLKDVSKEEVYKKVVIAYEPIWAIGTGVTATSIQAEEMCSFIREKIGKMYGANVAENIRIQYGGSVNTKNVKEILSMDNIDGALVGGASLSDDFVAIVNYDN